jgi:hypothetical protein
MEAATPAPPPPSEPPAQGGRVDVGNVLGETFSIYGSQAGVLLGSAAAVFVIVGVLQGLAAASGSLILVLLASVVAIVGSTLYGGFVVKLVEDVRDGRRDDSVGDLFRSAAGVIGTLIGNGILKGLAVAVGLILLVVPGLFLLTIWAVTGPAIVVERRGAIEAFGRSRELVKGDGWPVFAVIVIVFLIGVFISIISGAIGGDSDATSIVFSTIGSIIAAPISGLAAAIMFFALGGGGPQAPAPAGEPVDVAPPTPGT